VSEWPPQIVMIGAGFDARALRAVDLRWDLAPKVAPSHRLAAVKGGERRLAVLKGCERSAGPRSTAVRPCRKAAPRPLCCWRSMRVITPWED